MKIISALIALFLLISAVHAVSPVLEPTATSVYADISKQQVTEELNKRMENTNAQIASINELMIDQRNDIADMKAQLYRFRTNETLSLIYVTLGIAAATLGGYLITRRKEVIKENGN